MSRTHFRRACARGVSGVSKGTKTELRSLRLSISDGVACNTSAGRRFRDRPVRQRATHSSPCANSAIVLRFGEPLEMMLQMFGDGRPVRADTSRSFPLILRSGEPARRAPGTFGIRRAAARLFS